METAPALAEYQTEQYLRLGSGAVDSEVEEIVEPDPLFRIYDQRCYFWDKD